MIELLHIQEPPRSSLPKPEFALWQLGFRPFYLLASIFAALSIALWALQFAGWLAQPYLSGPMWHAHEMLFGFVLAVVVGFLFTAARNWTNRPTPTGKTLVALAALWIAARVLVLTPFGWAAAIANIGFPLAAAIALAIPFIASRNQRNYFFVGLLIVLSVAAAMVHLAQLGVVQLPGWVGIQVALDVVLFIMAVMAGRVVPMFTNNAISGAGAKRQPVIEKLALGTVLVLLLGDVLQWNGLTLIVLAIFSALVHLIRWTLWRPWKSLRTPIVWVLHVAYAWIPVYLFLRAAASLGWVLPSTATHALTVGAMGGLIIGMMTRTARGHTGRPLRADRYEILCYLLVLLSALVRVAGPLVAPAHLIGFVLVSAGLWSAAFGLYAIRYWPVLTRARLDGKPG